MPTTHRIGILNISDRAHAQVYEDLPGQAVTQFLEAALTSPWESLYQVLPDEQSQIERTFVDMATHDDASLIITTGGTGPSPRDITPEATYAVCQKMLPGFGEKMRAVSLQKVPTAILSRQTAGICERTLIVNLPGKPKAIHECLDAVFPAIPYCLDLIGRDGMQTDPKVIKSFRPPTS